MEVVMLSLLFLSVLNIDTDAHEIGSVVYLHLIKLRRYQHVQDLCHKSSDGRFDFSHVCLLRRFPIHR